ncbi:MAG: hypothetical protein DCF15_21525 [Phormidesmis priestleyi]|uniref:Uncharacterized protein n=1 Tax=Phormidesmis priestleyi TaxID=268141 RepID=A0A2W4YDS4_9CYAN|nr:MAG: hypothetical protein DCF15_21525 [Phormidesmis priestleyi]
MLQNPAFSMLLLLLANLVFGLFLQEHQGSQIHWIIAIGYIALECGILSIAWRPTRDFILLGFKSDMGYSLMAVGIAAFAVVVVAWIQISSYFFMLWAAALLLRIKLYTYRVNAAVSFLIMLLVSLLGLGISWVPVLIKTGQIASTL